MSETGASRSPFLERGSTLLVLVAAIAVLLFEPLFQGAAPLSFDNRIFPPFVVHTPDDGFRGEMNFATSDINGFVMPEAISSLERLKRGELPHWNPYLMAGQPLLADLGFPVFYPTTLLFLVLPLFLAQSWSLALHLLFLGLGTSWLLRRHGRGTQAALCGALVAMLCSFVVFRLHIPHFVRTVAWCPWLFLGAESLVARPRVRTAAWLGLGIGASLLAGMPQTALLQLFAVGIRALLLLQQESAGNRWRVVRAGLLAGGLGALVSAVQLLPASELLSESWRQGGLPRSELVRKRWEPECGLASVAPHFFGNPVQEVSADSDLRRVAEFPSHRRWLVPDVQNNVVENTVYVGLVTLLLVLLAIRCQRSGDRFFAAALVLSLCLAACVPGIIDVFRWLPGFSAGSPKRVLWIASFALAWLASSGMQGLLDKPQARWLFLGSAGFLAASVVGLLPYEQWWFPGETVDDRAWFRAELQRDWVSLAFSGAALGGSALLLRHRPKLTAALLNLVLAFDLVSLGRDFNPPQSPDQQFATTPSLEWLREQGVEDTWRFVPFRADYLLGGGLAQVFHLRNAAGVAAMLDRETGEFLQLIEADILDEQDPRFIRSLQMPQSLTSPLLDFLGVRFVVTSVEGFLELEHACKSDAELPRDQQRLAGLNLVLRHDDERIAIYERPDPCPPAFTVPSVRRISDPEERRDFLASNDFRPREEAVVDGEVPAEWLTREWSTPEVEFRRTSSQGIDLRLSTPSSAFLVVSESWFPGWRCRLGDEEIPLHRVNHGFLGFEVPPGDHQVQLFYDSPWFPGMMVLHVVAVAAGMILWLRRGGRA